MASNEMRKRLAFWSNKTGFTEACFRLNKNRKRILAYHNVIPDRFFDNTLHLAHSTRESSFIRHLEVISKRYNFGLDLMDHNSVTLTFDDGYLNQYTIAQKIMFDRGIMGYFFCAADLINGIDTTLGIDKIQYWLSYVPSGSYYINSSCINGSCPTFNSNSIIIPTAPIDPPLLPPITLTSQPTVTLQLNLHDKPSRAYAMKQIGALIKMNISMKQIEKKLNEAYSFEDIFDIEKEYYELRFMPISKEQLEEMKFKGHKIGAHSASHNKLSNMSEDQLDKEITECNEMLGHIYNTGIFCFPFGGEDDISQQVIDKIKNRGFSSSISYMCEPLRGSLKYHNFFIPRMILPDTQDEDLIDFILSGANYFIKYRKLLPKW